MYKELQKYKTGKTRSCDNASVSISGSICTATFTYQESEYEAPLGDLLNDFIEHQQKPFWRKKYYHSHLTELYIKMLNKLAMQHWL